MFAELKRKAFHLLGMVYIVALIYARRPVYIAVLVTLLSLTFAFEMVRLKNRAVAQWFASCFGGLLRDRERNTFSGFFWMLAGVTFTVILSRPVPLAAAALLYLLLGDTAASLIGIRFGGPHWPGSEKRISGSLACLLVCFFVGFVLLVPAYGWRGVVIGAITATLFERGLVPLDDNFTIPVASALALLFSYGLMPIR